MAEQSIHRFPARVTRFPLSILETSINQALSDVETCLLDIEKFKSSDTCDKYGTKNLYKRLKDHMKSYKTINDIYIDSLYCNASNSEASEQSNKTEILLKKCEKEIIHLKQMYSELGEGSLNTCTTMKTNASESKRADIQEKMKIELVKQDSLMKTKEIDRQLKEIEISADRDKDELLKLKEQVKSDEKLNILQAQLDDNGGDTQDNISVHSISTTGTIDRVHSWIRKNTIPHPLTTEERIWIKPNNAPEKVAELLKIPLETSSEKSFITAIPGTIFKKAPPLVFPSLYKSIFNDSISNCNEPISTLHNSHFIATSNAPNEQATSQDRSNLPHQNKSHNNVSISSCAIPTSNIYSTAPSNSHHHIPSNSHFYVPSTSHFTAPSSSHLHVPSNLHVSSSSYLHVPSIPRVQASSNSHVRVPSSSYLHIPSNPHVQDSSNSHIPVHATSHIHATPPTMTDPFIINSTIPSNQGRNKPLNVTWADVPQNKNIEIPSQIDYHRYNFDASTNHLAMLELKKTPAVPFNGDAFTYRGWMSSLENRMKILQLTSIDKIDILEAHTVGAPREVVQTFKIAHASDPDSALIVILQKLEKRFGHEFEISSELRQKIKKFPKIVGSESEATVALKLRKLSDLCQIVQAHMSTVNDLNTFNYPWGQELIREKMPEFLDNRWCYAKNTFLSKYGIDPPFNYLCEFLEEKAEILCYDKVPKMTKSLSTKDPSIYINSNTEYKKTTLHTSEVQEVAKHNCPLHKSNTHELNICALFNEMSYKMKRQLSINFNLCSKCLRGHATADCDSKLSCDICKTTSHITAMHHTREDYDPARRRNYFSPKGGSVKTNVEASGTSICTEICGTSHPKSCGKTLLVDVRAPNSSNVLRTYAILDEQSTNSFATSHVFDFLNLKSSIHEYKVSTMSSHHSRITGRIVEGLIIKGVREQNSYSLPKLYENDFMPDTKTEVATPDIVANHAAISHLSKEFPELDTKAQVCILIGRDAAHLMVTSPANFSVPVAHKTPIGWAMVGPVCPYLSTDENSNVTVLRTTLSQDHYKATLLFPTKYDSVFTKCEDDDMDGLSVEDRRFCDIIENNCDVNFEGNIEMPLPFKFANKLLPDNSKAVFNRQFNTLKRLKLNPDKLSKCISFMENTIKSNHVEQLSQNDIKCSPGKSWYLPVFPVVHPRKQKVRLVFDSAASYGGISLNSTLLQGPDQNNKLRGVLLRFREEEIAFVADISSMFHSFSVTPSCRDYLRFFWFRENDPSKEIVTYRARVHIFGNTCSPAIATIGLRRAADSLNNTNNGKSKLINDKVLQYIHKCFYVDDGLWSVSSSVEAIQILAKAREILSGYNIKLHKIISNDQSVMEAFPIEDREKIPARIDLDDCAIHRTLGVAWDVTTDNFIIMIDLPERPFTKRGILAVINSIYDPIGLASPVVLGGRLLQRKILPRKTDFDHKNLAAYGWDEELPENLHILWKQWRDTLTSLSSLRIPRSIKISNFGCTIRRNIHVFCDASEDAIGHVMYIQLINNKQEIHSSFLYGESKVSPRSATSIPRLELCAAVDAAQSAHKIINELINKPDNIYFYTDSRVVLGYITNEQRRFTQYVSRRVSMILGVCSSTQWQYIPTCNNPADLSTRPTTGKILSDTIWFSGPKCLLSENTYIENKYVDIPSELPEELFVEPLFSMTTKLSSNKVCFMDLLERKSSWMSCLRIVTRIISCMRLKLSEARKRLGLIDATHDKSADCRVTAHNIIIKEAQTSAFSDIYDTVKKNKFLHAKHPLAKLSPFLDQNGLLRVGGRLKNIDLPNGIKHPIILPYGHPLSTSILSYYHDKSNHQGRQITHGAIRSSGYYLEKGKTQIKTYLNKCVLCKKLRAKCEEQFMADLPADRLEITAPFTNTGLDVMGHWNVYDGPTTRRRSSTKKMWAVLFTCLVSRAVHIETLASLDTTSFQLALRRFLSLRGPCKLIRSDRGTNFVGASKDIDFHEMSNFIEQQGCKWIFNPPHASHFGGCWERKIGQIRRALDASIQKTSMRVLSREELHTFLLEAANIVNLSPLWDVSDDVDDPQPLSPSMLLTLKEASSPSTEVFSEDDLIHYGKKRWRRVQYLAHHFWLQWKTYYLEHLQIRQKWYTKQSPLEIGDIVILKDKNLKRNCWPLGIISDVKPSADGLIRSVVIKVTRDSSGNIKARYYERPISDVVLLVKNSAEKQV